MEMPGVEPGSETNHPQMPTSVVAVLGSRSARPATNLSLRQLVFSACRPAIKPPTNLSEIAHWLYYAATKSHQCEVLDDAGT